MAKKKVSKKKRSSKNTPSIKGMSISDLQAELKVRQREVTKLQRRREKLYEQISSIDSELAALGALSSSGAVLRRPKNEMNLVDSLAKTLKGKTMSVTEVAEAVQKQGYMTTAANFRTIVNQALIRETKVFKKVARGQYTAR
jgi:predicted transcriptional regulator